MESPSQVRGIASPPLNAATPPEHPVTHYQPMSQAGRVDGTDGKWIVCQLYISIHTIFTWTMGLFIFYVIEDESY